MQPTQTFHEHIRELRLRVFYVLVTLGVTGVLSYMVRNPVIRFIQKPLHQALYFTSPAGSFNFVIKVATILGIFLALPVIVYNIIKFIEPALPKFLNRKQIMRSTGGSFILAIFGASFGYFVIVPMSLHFFLSYSTTTVRPLITASEYLSFIINVLITFALIFQIPLIVLFINFIKPLKPRNLMRYQKYIIIGSLVVSVLLPFTYDPVSQLVLALPIVLMFYLSVILVKIVNRQKKNVKTVNKEINTARQEKVEQQEVAKKIPALAAAGIALTSQLSNPQVKASRTINTDGFIKSRPTRRLGRLNSYEARPIVDYKPRETKNESSRNKYLSIEGLTFAG